MFKKATNTSLQYKLELKVIDPMTKYSFRESLIFNSSLNIFTEGICYLLWFICPVPWSLAGSLKTLSHTVPLLLTGEEKWGSDCSTHLAFLGLVFLLFPTINLLGDLKEVVYSFCVLASTDRARKM